MIKKILLVVGIILFSFISYAQTALEQAQKAFSAGNYSDAAQLYEIMASTETDQAERAKLYDMVNKSREIPSLYEQADNARKANDYKLALECYEKIYKYNPNETVAKSQKDIMFAKYTNGHEYVDLGLSVKWATCNVGASSPEQYGKYYAWGEINVLSVYSSYYSKTWGRKIDDIQGNPQYDIARAKWGAAWKLPTQAEMEELMEKCTWIWTTKNGKNGYKVIGPNGNSIFLPAAGYRTDSAYDGKKPLRDVGVYGDYWTSTSYKKDDTCHAMLFWFANGGNGIDRSYRYQGSSIRPVIE